jgi:hypothetical protein
MLLIFKPDALASSSESKEGNVEKLTKKHAGCFSLFCLAGYKTLLL